MGAGWSRVTNVIATITCCRVNNNHKVTIIITMGGERHTGHRQAHANSCNNNQRLTHPTIGLYASIINSAINVANWVMPVHHRRHTPLIIIIPITRQTLISVQSQEQCRSIIPATSRRRQFASCRSSITNWAAGRSSAHQRSMSHPPAFNVTRHRLVIVNNTALIAVIG